MNSQQLTVSKAIDLLQSRAQDSIAVPGIGYLYGYDDYINHAVIGTLPRLRVSNCLTVLKEAKCKQILLPKTAQFTHVQNDTLLLIEKFSEGNSTSVNACRIDSFQFEQENLEEYVMSKGVLFAKLMGLNDFNVINKHFNDYNDQLMYFINNTAHEDKHQGRVALLYLLTTVKHWDAGVRIIDGYWVPDENYLNLLYSHPVMQKVFAALDKTYTKNEFLSITPLVSGPFEFNGYLSSYKE